MYYSLVYFFLRLALNTEASLKSNILFYVHLIHFIIFTFSFLKLNPAVIDSPASKDSSILNLFELKIGYLHQFFFQEFY